MTRRRLVRGLQVIVLITLATFGYLVYDGIRSEEADLAVGLSNVKPFWLLVAAVCALQEGVCGGLRVWILGRVLTPKIGVKDGVISEFVLMFCAGATPGQIGGPPGQVAVLMNSGMRFVDIATAELLVGSCTVLFFLGSAALVYGLRAEGMLVVDGAEQLDYLVLLSLVVFGSVLLGIVLAATYPPLLKGIFRASAPPLRLLYRACLRLLRSAGLQRWADARLADDWSLSARLIAGVDEFHRGFRIFVKRGKAAYVGALVLTVGFFLSRFAVAYFVLLALGIPVVPETFVSIGPPIVQVLLVQALLNFALYVSPTPGASGVAEAGSTTLMSPWVHGAFELPYLVLWRLLALFLCMFVGGIYVFRYLGTDVLEERSREAEEERRALGEAEEAREHLAHGDAQAPRSS